MLSRNSIRCKAAARALRSKCPALLVGVANIDAFNNALAYRSLGLKCDESASLTIVMATRLMKGVVGGVDGVIGCFCKRDDVDDNPATPSAPCGLC
eukprot:3348712-Pleurochrysis_carterae.AAC.3